MSLSQVGVSTAMTVGSLILDERKELSLALLEM